MIELSFCALRIVKGFVNEPDQPLYGYSISKSMQISRQAASQILSRLEDEGWLEREYRESTSRRIKNLYRITENGLREGAALLSKLQMPTDYRGIPSRISSGKPATLVARTLW